jgi:hypothetical protein
MASMIAGAGLEQLKNKGAKSQQKDATKRCD